MRLGGGRGGKEEGAGVGKKERKGRGGEGRGGCPKTFLPHSTTFLITLQS